MKDRLKKRIVALIPLALTVIFGLRYILVAAKTGGEKLLYMNSVLGRNLLQVRNKSFIGFLIFLAIYLSVKYMTYDSKKN